MGKKYRKTFYGLPVLFAFIFKTFAAFFILRRHRNPGHRHQAANNRHTECGPGTEAGTHGQLPPLHVLY
jgi:hypothetical protein